MTSTDLLFWYTGWAVWAVLGLIITGVVALICATVLYRAYRANVGWWWHYFVVARLRDVYRLTPDQLRDAVWEGGETWEEVQAFMAKARKICDLIEHAKDPQLRYAAFVGTNSCRWATENGKWYALCGSTWDAATMTPFKNDLMHCPCCARAITQTSDMESVKGT